MGVGWIRERASGLDRRRDLSPQRDTIAHSANVAFGDRV
jgi:hypothetical protein